MRAAAIFRHCRADSTFLIRRYLIETLQLSALVGLLAWQRLVVSPGFVDSEFALGWWHAIVFAISIPFGWFVASLVHNAGHSNFPSRVNRWIGELSGAYLGYGFTNFVLIHTLHHGYTDQAHDPVSPRGMTFWRYFIAPLSHPTRIARAYLLSVHGGTRGYSAVRAAEVVGFNLNLALRAAMWFLLFGPELFVCFYVPSIISDVGILAHINYACHRDRDDGSVEIVNLTGNLYYRLANAVTMGGYFHKNHHRWPRLIDPRVMGTPDISTPRREPETAGVLARYFDLAGIWGERTSPR